MHGHKLLEDYISKNKHSSNPEQKRILIEIGSTREISSDSQNSTHSLALLCNEKKIEFITVDMDPENTDNAKTTLAAINPNFKAITGKGEDFLKDYKGEINYLYLDAFDFYHDNHTEKRKKKYKEILGTEISNENCWRMHLECAAHVVDKMQSGDVICFDDVFDDKTYEGKGKLAIPFLLNKGFRVITFQPNALLMVKI